MNTVRVTKLEIEERRRTCVQPSREAVVASDVRAAGNLMTGGEYATMPPGVCGARCATLNQTAKNLLLSRRKDVVGRRAHGEDLPQRYVRSGAKVTVEP